MHDDLRLGPPRPFVVGTLRQSRGFVNVLDDTTLEVLLRNLDTVTDLTAYLEKKEQLIQSGRLVMATGEEELLALYLQRMNENEEHDFVLPEQSLIDEGFWERFRSHPDRLSQVAADKVSYAWDGLIEKFSEHLLAGTLEPGSHESVHEVEAGLRLMARENRTRRRFLSKALIGILRAGDSKHRATRMLPAASAGEVSYLFMSVAQEGEAQSEYRKYRRDLLWAACLVVRLLNPKALDIVGIATEPLTVEGRSEDMMYLDGRKWSQELERAAREARRAHNLFPDPHGRVWHEEEYPLRQEKYLAKGKYRNLACPCGSGLKIKQCCGRRTA